MITVWWQDRYDFSISSDERSQKLFIFLLFVVLNNIIRILIGDKSFLYMFLDTIFAYKVTHSVRLRAFFDIGHRGIERYFSHVQSNYFSTN